MKKFELVTEMTKEIFGKKLFRIRALVSFGCVNKGDLGGWIEKEDNLSQKGDAWVFGDARVFGDAWVSGDAQVLGNAWVFGNARVFGNAQVLGNAWVSGDAHWITISPIGSKNGTLTAFRQKDNSIMVKRGCFSGTIEEFEKAVNERHGDSKHGDIYRALIPVIKARLEVIETDEDTPKD